MMRRVVVVILVVHHFFVATWTPRGLLPVRYSTSKALGRAARPRVVYPPSILMLMVNRVSLVFRIMIAAVKARIVTIVVRARAGLISVADVCRSTLRQRWTAGLFLVWVSTLIASVHHVVAIWLIVSVILTPLLVAAVPRLLSVSSWPVTVNTTRWFVAVVLAVFIISWPLIIKILISTNVQHRTTSLIVVAISFVSFVRHGIPLAGRTAVW